MSDEIKKMLAQAETQTDAMSSVTCAECGFESEAEAENNFARLKEKLVNVERWNAHAALMSFALFGAAGEAAKPEQTAAVDDFIRLSLTASGKDDWVKITRIDERATEMILTVRPARNPTEKADEAVTSHFFTSESSNNFCLERHGKKIIFHVIGLNEKANTRDTNNLLETVRNAGVANLGHYLGIQHFEWTQFCENFLEK
jgi:hypothetical protein